MIKPLEISIIMMSHLECPFREFRDNELSPDYWGMGPSTFRTAMLNKVPVKQAADYVWKDEQIQPLPRSAREYLHGWVRAHEVALSRWGDLDLVISEENDTSTMSLTDMQYSHTQVLQRSSFCRRVLSACFVLEKVDTMVVEHQWESFSCSLPEGWRAKYHIYSPGTKPGGGTQHRPGPSRNGCYLVRLYYLGAWRCVWVSDQVPVDAMGSPLLPFSPLLCHTPLPTKPLPGVPQGKQQSTVAVLSNVVHLWPLLLCKALLKLAAPDIISGEEDDCIEDEVMSDLKIFHALTGTMELKIGPLPIESLWERLTIEVPVFSWDTDDETLTVRSKNVKKPVTKDSVAVKRGSIAVLKIRETKDMPYYFLPGISPSHEMGLYISMIRDLPLKKPPSEPEVALWKRYRWVDWARAHGLYDDYDCPNTRFIRVTGFMKMSFAPHLLDVRSTATIDKEFTNKEQDKKAGKEVPASPSEQMKEELREWNLYNNVFEVVKHLIVMYLPSMYEFTTAGDAPSVKITKVPWNRAIDIIAPTAEPLYLQIDGPDSSKLRASLSMLHPRVITNCHSQILDYVEPAYLLLEPFDWFEDTELPRVKAYVWTRSYDTMEIDFPPGRHCCRVWVHSRMHWHIALLSDSTLLLGTRDAIMAAAVHECPWASTFLTNLGTAFTNLLRNVKSSAHFGVENEFYLSYQPDLTWDDEVVGYNKHMLHWMMRQALQSLLVKRLPPPEFTEVCSVLRHYLLDPDFGLPKKKWNMTNWREIIAADPCDCIKSEESIENIQDLECMPSTEEVPRQISEALILRLHSPPKHPTDSKICELATDIYPCEVLKEERDNFARQHEAATFLQSRWRAYRARKYLSGIVPITPDVMKIIMDTAFGNPEALSALMNEFFAMYPGAKSAYSVSTALTGSTGVKQYTGTVATSPNSTWVPYFQGVFTCHSPVIVHFDVQGMFPFRRVAIYDNDSGCVMSEVYRTHVTYHIKPNTNGYMVLGYGSLYKPLGTRTDANWQLTIISSLTEVFHMCDNSDSDNCHEIMLSSVTKLHVDEVFLPNRRHILGGVKVLATQLDAISFRAAASSPNLELIATLRTQSHDGSMVVVDQCKGKGVLFWPYVKLMPDLPSHGTGKPLTSHGQAVMSLSHQSEVSEGKKKTTLSKKPSGTKVREAKRNPSVQTSFYTIELTCPEGWPLTLNQWKRVEEIRNLMEAQKTDTKKTGAGNVSAKQAEPARKIQSARDKAAAPKGVVRIEPQPGDAYVALECSLTVGRGTVAIRDDERELQFDAACRSWNAKEPGRNQRGAQIRKEFREEFLVPDIVPPTESFASVLEGTEILGEHYYETETGTQTKHTTSQSQALPTIESGMSQVSAESEEEAVYLELNDDHKDKFVDMPFISECWKEMSEKGSVVLTKEIFDEAIVERQLSLETAIQFMEELQEYNLMHILRRQAKRTWLLEKKYVDGTPWTPELCEVLEKRDEAIQEFAAATALSSSNKKGGKK